MPSAGPAFGMYRIARHRLRHPAQSCLARSHRSHPRATVAVHLLPGIPDLRQDGKKIRTAPCLLDDDIPVERLAHGSRRGRRKARQAHRLHLESLHGPRSSLLRRTPDDVLDRRGCAPICHLCGAFCDYFQSLTASAMARRMPTIPCRIRPPSSVTR